MKKLLPGVVMVSKFTLRIFLIQIVTVQLLMAHGSHGQGLENVMVSLELRDARIGEVFSAIERQTEFRFAFSRTVKNIDKTFDLTYHDVTLKRVLEYISAEARLSFRRVDRTITVQKQMLPPQQTVLPARPEPTNLPARVTVSGSVTGTDGIGLPGVNVLEKGTINGTTTDVNGNYRINVSDNAVLVFSFIGYAVEERAVNEQAVIDVLMIESIAQLDEVVITTGYQKINPEQSTGSVTVLKAREFESQVNNDILAGLESRIPGLMINNDVSFTSTVDGETASRSLFNIRGISTISGSQDPLIVVDGFPTELTLDMINPNEIESITVLKDAAAATIYGVRASNGVIVIERKKAKEGKLKIQYRTNIDVTPKENYSRYEYASNASALAVDYIRALNTSVDSLAYKSFYSYAGRYNEDPVYYILAMQAGDIIPESTAEEALAALEKYDNTQDYERLFLRNAITQNHNLNVSGGSDNILYYLTLNHVRNRLSQIKNDDERTSISIRTDLKFSKRLSLQLTSMYMESDANSAPIPDVNTAYRFERYADEDGNALPITSGSVINPYYNTYIMSLGLQDHLYYPLIDAYHINDHAHTVNNRINANFRYDIGKGLNFALGGIYERSRADNAYYADEQSTEVRQVINNFTTVNADGTLTYNIPVGAFLNETTAITNTYTLRAQLNYNTNIRENHSVDAILGGEVRRILTEGSSWAYYGYNKQNLLQQAVDYSELEDYFVSELLGSQSLSYPFSKSYQEDRFLSVYANVVYSFRNTYSLTGSFRIDQSNLFGTNPKYRYKPLWSAGAAWNVHKEYFMSDVDWLTNLKLRVAYGFNGNVAKNSLPEVIAASYLNTDVSPSAAALELYSLANSTLRWEQTSNFNVGLDFGLSEHINGAVDIYTKRSTDVLNKTRIDPTYGSGSSLLNEASIINKGFEFNLQADWISTLNFNWNTGLIFSRNSSEVLDVYEYSDDNLPNELNTRGYVPGYPIGAMFVFRDGGLNDAGYPVVLDEEGAGYATTDLSTTTEGLTYYVGSSIPTMNLGLSNRIDIGNFYVFVMMGYYGGFKVQVPRIRPGDPVVGSDNYWKEPGDEATTDIVGIEANSFYLTHHIYDNLDKYVVNGDYVTLKTITASYNFHHNNFDFLEKSGIENFELKIQASNIFTVGLNKYNYSPATGDYYKKFLTPTYTASALINF